MNDERDARSAPERGTDGPPIALIVGVIVAVLAAVFVISNRERVEIDFVLFTVQSRTWTALVVSIGLGIVLDRLFLTWWRRRRRRGSRSL